MIFEVESSASSSMANNAMKVFSQDVDNFVKPLFFFHLLLRGGADNERIAGLRSTWGKYNYRVYRLNDAPEVQRPVTDILGQHRRVSDVVNLRKLMSVLNRRSWSSANAREVFESAERLEFATNYLRELALLATADPSLQSLFLARLREHHLGHREYPGSYRRYVGEWFGTLVDVALLVGNDAISDQNGAELLSQWQNKGRFGLTAIGPHFGLSCDYDDFVIGPAPFLFAVAAALCQGNRLSKTWIVRELSALIDGEEERGVAIGYITAARIWLLHIAVSTLRDFSNQEHSEGEADILDIYQRARNAVSAAKTPLELLRNPPSYSELVGEDAESLPIGVASVVSPLVDFPEWTEVSNGYFPALGQSAWSDSPGLLPWLDSFGLATGMLAREDWFAWSTNDLVRLLHGEHFPRECASLG
jgi:hypothetical protein